MLIQRIISAVFLILPIIAGLVFAPQPWASLLGFLLYVLAAWEWSGFVPQIEKPMRVLLTVAYSILMVLTYVLVTYTEFAIWLLVLAILWWIVATINVLRYPFAISKPFIVISGALVLIPAFASISLSEGFGNSAYGIELLWVFLLVWAADIGAYFVGRQFGTHKLAPSVSPGKTWEGLVGGAVLAMIVAWAIAFYADIAPIKLLPLSMVVVLFSVIGDLTVSLFKRNAQVKDAGRIFPGHGGVLDRFDSFSAAAPVMIGLILAGVMHGFLML